MTDLSYPWAGEAKRPSYQLAWGDFLRAYARVQARFDARMRELREADNEKELSGRA